jgi:hypothetical protein
MNVVDGRDRESGVCGLFVALIGGAVVMLVRVRDRWRS